MSPYESYEDLQDSMAYETYGPLLASNIDSSREYAFNHLPKSLNTEAVEELATKVGGRIYLERSRSAKREEVKALRNLAHLALENQIWDTSAGALVTDLVTASAAAEALNRRGIRAKGASWNIQRLIRKQIRAEFDRLPAVGLIS